MSSASDTITKSTTVLVVKDGILSFTMVCPMIQIFYHDTVCSLNNVLWFY